MVNKSIKLIKILSLMTMQFIIINSSLQQANVEIAINCGGPEYKSKNGVIYRKDNYFNGGESSDFGTNSLIKNTKDQEIYQTERWSSEDLIYNIPITNYGKFVLVLKFSEVFFNNKGDKVFDVKIGDQTILEDIDIYSKVGKAVAYDEFIPFEIKEGELLIEGKKVENGFDAKNKIIKITFVKKQADNPKINAIIIVRGGIEQTDFKEYKKSLESLSKKKVEDEKKNREFQRMSKSIDYEDFEDDFTDDGKKYRASNKFFSGKTIFFTLIVIAVIYFMKNK